MSATRDAAISRKGNVGNEHAPASSPAVAHRRAKRIEWRMRGIEPYNKIIVVFPSSVLPSRRFGNPPSPEGEGLIACVHDVISSVVEKSPAAETARCIYAPAYLPTVAHRREIPYSRNDDTRTRITDQANTLNATVIARSAATWQSPGREDLLAYTDKILARTGSVPRQPNARTGSVPAPAHLPAAACVARPLISRYATTSPKVKPKKGRR